MSISGRWGGFRTGRRLYQSKWDELKGPSITSDAPTSSAEFDYTTAKGIWNLNSTVQFRKLSQLYPFTSFTFTSGGQLGYTGPSLATLLSSYDTSTYSWLNDTTFFNMTTTGIQEWTVPATGNYEIDAYGATGGYAYLNSSTNISYGGRGARLKGTFSLTEGDVIKILVGQRGRNNPNATRGGGGGGGTFVYNNTTSTLLIAAGAGGGGGQYARTSGADANHETTSGNPGLRSSAGAAGTGGNGGGNGTYTGGGAGWLTDGADAGANAKGGHTFSNGGNGGENRSTLVDNDASNANGKPGGFGGGGGSYAGAGGGGGYSGGGGGGWSNSGEGGGGGSYIDSGATNTLAELDTSQDNGNGQVIITRV